MTEQKIRYLFRQYFTDHCTESERAEFLQLIDAGEHDEAFLTVMEECWDTYAPDREVPELTSERIYADITGPSRDRRGLLFMGRIQWLAGAAALVTSFVVLLFLLKRKEKGNDAVARGPIPTHDVAPGGNKAVLILADGKTIVLDSAADGKLAQLGSVKVVKLENGRLGYQGSGGDGSRKDGNDKEGNSLRYNTISTPNGGQYQVTLADGTKVWLNAASTLVFPTAFTGASREVTLKGEGYFEVAANATQPFVVHVRDMKVNVLGTHFNVMAYEEEDAVRTTLLEGAVKLGAGGMGRLLSPGQQGVWDRTNRLDVVSDADVEEAVAWKNGLLQFHSAPISVIMRQIARWYDVRIVYTGDIKDEPFSGSIPSKEPVSQVLKMLEMTNSVHFDVEGRTISVRTQ